MTSSLRIRLIVTRQRDSNAVLGWDDDKKHFTPTMLDMIQAQQQFDYRPTVAWNKFTSASRLPPFDSWFGVHEYLLVTRVEEISDYMGRIDPSDTSLFLSAISLALNNCNCNLPVFVAIQEPSRKAFVGAALPGTTGSVSIRFETDSVPELSTNQSCISGLLDFFRLKLQLSDQTNNVPISVSATFKYLWTNYAAHEAWIKLEGQDEWLERKGLVWGTRADPLNSISLHLCWPQLREGSYVDNAVHSTLKPMDAPVWRVLPSFRALQVDTDLKLTAQIQKIVAAYAQTKELGGELLVSEIASSCSDDSLLSERLSGTIPGARAAVVLGNALGTLVSSATRQPDMATISKMIDDLFESEHDPVEMDHQIHRGVPVGRLISLFTLRLVELQTLPAMCLFWVLFVKELRRHWDNGLPIPHMSVDAPDFRCSLLHQKLQMLNCCIAKRVNAKSELEVSNAWGDDEIEFESDQSDEEEEFFESMTTTTILSPLGDGRAYALEGLKSVKTKTQLYKPVTQDAVPVTEDSIRQQEEILSRLGSSEGVKIRQQLQSVTLLSDMQAFKAANPGCVLADFIRWHSPRDWIAWDTLSPEEQVGLTSTEWCWVEQGVLSERMRDPTNLWHQTWRSAAPISAASQRPIFNAAQEAEKAFHYLETIAPYELFRQLTIGMLSNSIWVLKDASTQAQNLPVIESTLANLIGNAQQAVDAMEEAYQTALTWNFTPNKQDTASNRVQVALSMAIEKLKTVTEQISDIETAICHGCASLKLFPTESELVNRILLHQAKFGLTNGCELVSEQERNHLCALFVDSGELELKQAVSRQYILTCTSARPFYLQRQVESASQLVMNRFFAGFNQDTVRFALALGESEF